MTTRTNQGSMMSEGTMCVLTLRAVDVRGLGALGKVAKALEPENG